MAQGDIDFPDRLVRGTIQTVYDFAKLSIFGMLLPGAKYCRVWPVLIRTEKRYSTLTHLFVSILFAVALASGNDATLASGFAGLNKTEDVWVVYMIAVTIFISVLMDALICLCLMPIRIRIRRERYQRLSRLSVANLYLGGSITMLLLGQASIFGRFSTLLWQGEDGLSPISPILLNNPLGIVFAFSLAFVVGKASGIKGWTLHYLIWPFVVIAAPLVFLNLSFWLYVWPSQIRQWLAPVSVQGVGIRQQSTQCVLSSGQIRVSSYLMLYGTPSLPFELSNFTVYYVVPSESEEVEANRYYVGRVLSNQGDVVLTDKGFSHLGVIASFEPADPSNSPKVGTFECLLAVIKDPNDLVKSQSDVDWATLPAK